MDTTATDLADCSALTLLALYRAGDASPVEATRAVLDRIERLNPVLNAFCHLAPEEALAAARDDALPAGMSIEPTERVSIEQLMDWANIEPDPDLMRSTRRLGAPITWAKRQLIHVMRQYLRELQSQQTRFNLNVLIRVAELEDRVARLEERATEREPR